MKNRLKLFRSDLGWTQEDLAKRVGVSRQAIIALESGKHSPSLDLAFRIATEFSAPVDRVFENPHQPSSDSPA